MKDMQAQVRAGQNTSFGMLGAWRGTFPEVSTVDVILKPDDLCEFYTTDQVPPWGGEVILKGVPVHGQTQP
jgi:hypothetical protein